VPPECVALQPGLDLASYGAWKIILVEVAFCISRTRPVADASAFLSFLRGLANYFGHFFVLRPWPVLQCMRADA
jgi:hypothetical protein